MKSGMMGLLAVLLCGLLGADASRDGGGPKGTRQRERAGSPASRPAMAGQADDNDAAMRPPGWQRDWWPRRDGRARDGMPGAADRPRLKQGPGGPPWLEDNEPLSPEQEARLMEFASKNFPQLHQRLIAVRDSNPILFGQMIKRVRGPISEIMRVQERNPELAEKLIQAHRIEIEITDLRGQYLSAGTDQQREQIKSKMRELVTRRGELRLERLKDEVRDLEKRLDQAKNEVVRREKNKDQIVEQEMKKFLAGSPVRPGEGLLPKPPGPGPKGGKRGQAQPPPPPPDAPAPIR
jgi:hypothetical protein